MPHAMKRPPSSSYSHCPLKKRPLKYDPLAEDNYSEDSDFSCKGSSPPLLPAAVDPAEPENLSTKPEDLRLQKTLPSPPSSMAGQRIPPQQEVFSHYCSPPTTEPKLFPSYIKSTNGPLGPISLNAPATTSSPSSWGKIHPLVPVPMPYAPPTATTALSHHLHRPAAYYGRTQQSHFPQYNISVGSPPHLSPPLGHQHEPAYPVLRIEENRPRMVVSPESHPSIYNNHQEIRRDATAFTHQQEYYYHQQQQLSPAEPPKSPDFLIKQEKIEGSAAIVPISVNGSLRYQCSDCNKSYSTYSGLNKHVQFHCASQNKKSFVCKFCEKLYNSLGALKMHIRTHTLPCKCNLCGKAFSRPWLLQGHIRTHTGEKPFTCQHCHRAFADRSNLRAHLQTHSEVKKYCCKSCSKTFSRSSLLQKHMEGGCSTVGSNGLSGCDE